MSYVRDAMAGKETVRRGPEGPGGHMKHSNAVSNMMRWGAKLASAIEKRKQLPPGIAKADAIENEMHCQEKYSEWVRKAQEEQDQKGRED